MQVICKIVDWKSYLVSIDNSSLPIAAPRCRKEWSPQAKLFSSLQLTGGSHREHETNDQAASASGFGSSYKSLS